MSARVIDFLGMRRGIGVTIESFVPGIVTHWENQNQPAPRDQPYISLSLRTGFVYSSLAQEKKIKTLNSAIVTIPDPLPAIGEAVWMTIDDWYPIPSKIIEVGDTPESVRDYLVAQLLLLRPVRYAGYFTVSTFGTNAIRINAAQLGGLLQVLGYGGITVQENVGPVSLYASMPMTFVLRMQCYGTSSTATSDFLPVGDNHASSIWSTLSFKMRRRSFARKLFENAAVALWSYPSGGQEIPAILGGGIEPRTIGEVTCATQALDFETLPVEVQEIFVHESVNNFGFDFNFNIDTKHQLPL